MRQPWLAPLPPGVRFRRLPGRRHGPGQDRPGTRPAGGRRELRAASRKRRRPPPSLVVVPRSLVFNWKQEAARFTPKLRVLDHTGIGRGKPGTIRRLDVILTTYGTLRKDIVDLKDYRRLRHPRRGPGDQEREQPVGEGGPADPMRAPPGPQRHAGREPPRRVVEPVRVPQPGHARQGRGSRQGRRPYANPARRPVAPGESPQAVPPPAPRSRSRKTCPRSPNRRSTATWNRPSASCTTSCEHYRNCFCSPCRARRDQEVEDPDPRALLRAKAGRPATPA